MSSRIRTRRLPATSGRLARFAALRACGCLAVLCGVASAQAAPAGARAGALPTPHDTVRFAAIGDYGLAGPDEADVAALVHALSPDLVITTGDNNYLEGAAATIDANIGQYYHDYIAPYAGSYGAGAPTNRFFPALGNHDWVAPGAQPYLDYFQLPGNERYYTFAAGSVRFWAVDSDSQEPDGITHASAQAQWLRAGLLAATEPFQVVYLHHAPYSSGDHGSNGNLQWPFREWGADLVLSGHDHHYERLSIAGFPYVVDGFGGAGLYYVGPPLPGSQVRYNSDHGAVIADARPDRMLVTAVSARGFVVDQIALPVDPSPSAARYVPAGSVWRYRDDGTDLGTAWRAPSYDDTAWSQGPAQLGYGDGDEATQVAFGPDPNAKWTTTYFRRAFDCPDPAALDGLLLEVLRDDGVVVHLNGVEVARSNLPVGRITSGTLASTGISGPEENAWTSWTLPASALVAGTNVLAVEVHQVSGTSSDLSFDLRLTGSRRGDLLVPRGSTWRFRDGGLYPGAGWTSPGFDASGWASGPAQLGYGDGDEVTTISSGPNPLQRPITSWFRREFTVSAPASVHALGLRILADDGVVVHLNGVAVFRRNLPLGAVAPGTATELALGPGAEDVFLETLLDPSALRAGVNVLAVELHQRSPVDDDASFDLELVAW